MPTALCFFLLGAIFCGCASPAIPRHETETANGYCEILHVAQPELRPSASRAFLGIYLAEGPPDAVEEFPCEQVVRIAGIINGSAASAAGLRKEDRILSLDGVPVCRLGTGSVAAAFKGGIEKNEVGSTVVLGVLREGAVLERRVSLKARPSHEQPEADYEALLRWCSAPSLLAQTIAAQGQTQAFAQIQEGLRERSNEIHNMGWEEAGQANPYQNTQMTAMLRHPTASGVIAGRLSDSVASAATEDDWSPGKIVDLLSGIGWGKTENAQARASSSLNALLEALESAGTTVQRATAGLGAGERDLVHTMAPQAREGEHWNRYLESALAVDRAELVSALGPLLNLLSKEGIGLLKRDLIERFGEKEGILFEQDTAGGRVVVGGTGANVYEADAALILDLGGDDIYLNNAGGSREEIPVAVLVDWSGNDTYFSRAPFSQGSGFLGGGILIDLGGSDIFDGGAASQGAGLFGLGLLISVGGDKSFSGGLYSQGVGQGGLGALISIDGRTNYDGVGWGQGLGLPGGVGVLVDVSGDDRYRIGGAVPDHRDPERFTVSMGQGFGEGFREEDGRMGVSGGVGMLVDIAGNDRYLADYFGQGASYYFAAGILDDRGGNDRYLVGRYGQGAGIHASVGTLLDRDGNDTYVSSYGVAQGMGHDFGVGVLDDRRGDDVFRGGKLVQGAATRDGVGILVDRAGANMFSLESAGGGFAEDEECAGVKMDLGGDGIGADRVRVAMRQDKGLRPPADGNGGPEE